LVPEWTTKILKTKIWGFVEKDLEALVEHGRFVFDKNEIY
jgi:hypothetical protein